MPKNPDALFPDALGIPPDELSELCSIGRHLMSVLPSTQNLSGVLLWFLDRPFALLQKHVLFKQGVAAFNNHPFIQVFSAYLYYGSGAYVGTAHTHSIGAIERFVTEHRRDV